MVVSTVIILLRDIFTEADGRVSPNFFLPTGTMLDGFLLCLVSLPMEELLADLLLVLVIEQLEKEWL